MPDIALSWNLSSTSASEVGGQRIYRSSTSNPSFPSDYTQIASVSDSATSFTDTGVSDGAYTYAVTAYNSAGESSPTTDGAVTPIQVPASTATGTSPTPTTQATGSATVSAPASTAQASTPTPTVSGRGATTVAVPTGAATGTTPSPALPAGIIIDTPVSTTQVDTPTPTVSGVGAAGVAVPASLATSTTPNPAVSPGGAAVELLVSTTTADSPALTFRRAMAVPTTTATAAAPAPVVFEGQGVDILHTVRLGGDFTVQRALDGTWRVTRPLDGDFTVQRALDGEID